MWKLQPLEKSHPFFPSNLSLKIEIVSSPLTPFVYSKCDQVSDLWQQLELAS